MRRILPSLAILVVLVAVGPHVADALPGCGFHRLTGWHCPGCGSTRAVKHLVRGEIGAAVDSNPLLILGLPLLGLIWAGHAWRMSRSRRPAGEVPGWALWAIGTGVVLFWILRNVPVYPFTWLAP